MSTPFPIIDVAKWPIYSAEPMGTKAKDWRLSSTGERWLLKLCRKNDHTGVYAGEDWSEKIACELAAAIGLPHAIVDLAILDGQPGVIVKDFVADRNTRKLTHGNEMLATRVAAYPKEQKRGVSLHTVERVMAVLSEPFIRVSADLQLPASVQTPPDLFVGYLMLDAWIGNIDRHHENWAVVEVQEPAPVQTRSAELAPTFDHASSLGREMDDNLREAGLEGTKPRWSPTRYREKARSAFYGSDADPVPLSPVAAFRWAAGIRPDAARAWLGRLEAVSSAQVQDLLNRVPSDRLSSLARVFTLALLESAKNELQLLQV